MKTFVIIGLNNLGIYLLEDLAKLNDCQVIIIDTSRDLVEEYDILATESFIVESFTKNNLKKMIPSDTDAVIIDMDDNFASSSLITHYINLLGVKNIYVKTEDVDEAEILKLLGATKIIFPSKDAAKRLTPLLISPFLSTYNIIGHDVVVAEMKIPKEYVGKTLLEADLRKEKGITVVAVRNLSNSKYEFVESDYYFLEGDRVVVCGKPQNIETFSDSKDLIQKTNFSDLEVKPEKSNFLTSFTKIFNKK